MSEARRFAQTAVKWILTATIFLMTPACGDDPLESEDNLEGLSAVWELHTTVTSNNCGSAFEDHDTERVILMQCDGNVSLIMNGGVVGEGTVSGNSLDFMCTEPHVDNSGCCSTHYLLGTVSGTTASLSGSLATNVIFDAGTCARHTACKVETASTLELISPYRESCLNRASFGSPVQSEYMLPWSPGRSYALSNSYCVPTGGHSEQIAYDFLIPIGDKVLAARPGTVRAVKESSPDDGKGSDHNHVMIEHEDGTVALYAHLKKNGVLVEVGEEVEAGQLVALAGHSGTTDVAHLHFGVYASYPPVAGSDIPVNFRNTEGPLDCRGGLVEGGSYEAN